MGRSRALEGGGSCSLGRAAAAAAAAAAAEVPRPRKNHAGGSSLRGGAPAPRSAGRSGELPAQFSAVLDHSFSGKPLADFYADISGVPPHESRTEEEKEGRSKKRPSTKGPYEEKD